MPYCCVPFCKAGSDKRENVSLHEFPSDASLTALWLKAISREDFVPNSYSSSSRVCGKHFVEADFIPNRKYRCLKPGVVPSQFDLYPSFKKKVSIKKQLPAKRRLDVDAGISLSKICKLTDSSSMTLSEEQLKNDVENYMRHKLQGGKLYLKKGVLPHKFECQKKSVPAASSKRAAARKHKELIAQALQTNVPSASDVGKDVEEVDPAIGETHLRNRLKKSTVPSLSSSDKLEIIQHKEVAAVGRVDERNNQQKSMEMNCPVSMSVTVSDHQTVKQEVVEPLKQKVDENPAQEKYCAQTQKKIIFKDLGNLEDRGNQMSERRTMSNSPNTTCKENVPFPVVDIKQEPQDTILTTDQKMERALAITDKLALFMSESSFFHEHMTFLQSIYDSWASGKVALKIQEEVNAKEIQNEIGSNEIQDKGSSTVKVLSEISSPVSGVTQTGNLVESSNIIPAKDKICECPKDSTKAIGFSKNKRHNTASSHNTHVPDSIQIHSSGPSSSRTMTSSILPTNQVILYQQNSLSTDKNPVKDPVPSPIGTILGFIIQAQMNNPQDCIKHLNQPCPFTSIPTIVKLNQS